MFFGKYLEESFLLRKYHWLTFQNNTISSYEPSFAFLCLTERERDRGSREGSDKSSLVAKKQKKNKKKTERQENLLFKNKISLLDYHW